MRNVVTAVFVGMETRANANPSAWQYDYGQILKIEGLDLPDTYEVHFTNDERGIAKTVIATSDEIPIPDEYLQSGKGITAYMYLHEGEDDGETEYKVSIYVNKRALPIHEQITEVRRSEVDELIAAMNVSASKAKNSAEDAEAWSVGQRNSIDVEDTDETYENNAKYYATQSELAYSETQTAKEVAEKAAEGAAQSKEESEEFALTSKSYAVGSTGTRDGEDTDNAKYYKEQTAQIKADALEEVGNAVTAGVGTVNDAGSTQVNAVNTAGTTQVGNVNTAGETQVAAVNQAGTTQVAAVKSEGEAQVSAVKAEGEKQTAAAAAEAGKAEDSAEDAEAWAVGKRNGVDVPATDPTYQNNAKWISEHIYVTLGVDDTPSETSENPVMNKALVLGDENTKAWHLGLYIDSDGDLCQA